MAIYSAGLRTKQHILGKCKEMFYSVGYSNISFNELCKAAGVNQGSLVYHFKGKLQVAQQIYAETMASMQNQLTELFPDDDEFAVVLLCLFAYYDLFFRDENLRRFWVQISQDNMESVIADQYKSYSPVLHRYLERTLSVTQREMIIASTTGADIALQQYLFQNIAKVSFDNTIGDICKCMFYYMDKDVLNKAIESAWALYRSVHISNDGFEITIGKDQSSIADPRN